MSVCVCERVGWYFLFIFYSIFQIYFSQKNRHGGDVEWGASNMVEMGDMYNLDAENGCFYFIDWNSMYSWILKRSMAFIIIRPYLCNYCKCRFKRKHHLVDHIRIHTGERPYTCGECGNRFKSSSNLYSHMKIHTCLKPYVCKYCTKAFNRKYNLNVHIRNIHHHTM